MKLIGFNLSKVSIEKISDNFKEFKIDTNLNLIDINQIKTDLFKSKEDLLGVRFKYIINYSPNLGKILFEGNILLSLDQKDSKKILKDWKNKKLQEDFKITVFNVILRKCNIKALQLEDEMNFPIHLPLPVLRKESKKDTK